MKHFLLIFSVLVIRFPSFSQENDSITLSKSELQKEIEKEVNRQLAQREVIQPEKKVLRTYSNGTILVLKDMVL